MKIAYDNQIFFIEKYGGISRYFTSLLNELVKTGNEYKIFSIVHVNEYLSHFDKKIINGLKFEKYPPKTTTILNHLSKIVNKVNLKSWKPDLIHETFYSLNRTYTKRSPIVITIHDMIHELYPSMFNNEDNTSIYKKSAVDRADKIICVSETTKRDLVNIFSVPENKIEVIYHGYTFLQNESNLLINLISVPEEPYLLYIGKRGGYKNFERYLNSISNTKTLKNDFKLIFFGGGSFTKNELNLFFKLGFDIDDFLYLEGDDSLLQSLLKNATAFIYPSLYEGFGLPLLEAMQCGCPIIASNSGSIPEIAKNAAEYFDPTSIDDMALNITKVVYSQERINVLKHNCQIQIKNYSWEKAATLTNSVYKKLL